MILAVLKLYGLITGAALVSAGLLTVIVDLLKQSDEWKEARHEPE